MRFLVSAGPTREPLDDVRFISNPSTGRMGYAVALAAQAAGHSVTLVSGPTTIQRPEGVKFISVITAQEMLDAIKCELATHDVVVMTAAVADIRPAKKSDGKLKKQDVGDCIAIERTQDILVEIGPMKEDRIYVGFAAESGDPVSEAKRKCAAKGLDLVVANDLTREDSGFGSDTNKAYFVDADGGIEELPVMTKLELAERIVEWIQLAACR